MMTFDSVKEYAKTIDKNVLISFDVGYGKSVTYTILCVRGNTYDAAKVTSLDEDTVKPLVKSLIQKVEQLYDGNS